MRTTPIRAAALVTLLFAVLLAGSCRDAEAPTPDYTPQQNELLLLSDEWNRALAEKDGPALEGLLADGFYISPPGELRTTARAEWLKNAQDMDWRDLKFKGAKVDIYGDTAVVTSRLDFKVTTKSGIPISTDSQVIDVWTKRSGKWQVAARHLGEYSLISKLRVGAGFVLGLVACAFIWAGMRLLRRLRRRRT
jgi:ketosteroid isomerase-like protein